MEPRQAYDELIGLWREAALLSSTSSVLNWDKETYMPPAAGNYRAEQLSLLAGMVHDKTTSARVGELLAACEGTVLGENPVSAEAVNLREIRRLYDKHAKLPRRLVEELARATSLGHAAWVEARSRSEFGVFLPWLEKIVGLTREKAQAYGYRDSPYDPLLDDYEPGAATAEATALFAGLRAELVPLVERVAGAGNRPDVSILQREYPVEAQRLFGRMAAAVIGFDFRAGRLDEVVHPFCTTLGAGDVRITTRYNPRFINESFFGVLHEAGHALYEQGLPPEHFGTPMGETVSLAIHESQSRMWENHVGRGRAFWEHFFPLAQGAFPNALGDVSLEAFHRAINVVEPSFIRVEADEVTYNLHIILRFELEQALIAGELAPADVPGAWNERFEKMFGLKVPDDRRGCLQDTHWAIGAIGYFPTYCLGNLFAAQFFEAAQSALDDLEGQMARGRFEGLLGWLREQIHREGMRWRARDLVQRVTGRPLSHEPLMRHLRRKVEGVYGG